MKRAKELTAKEIYIATKTGQMMKWSSAKSNEVKRTISEIRQTLKRRSQHNLYEEFKPFVKRIRENKFESMGAFSKACWKHTELMKYQGYLVRDYCEAEWEAEQMTDDEIRRWIVLNEI